MKTIKDIFFFYLVDNGEKLLRATLDTVTQSRNGRLEVKGKYPGMRESALAEIRALELIIIDSQKHPEYPQVCRDFYVRMRQLKYPEQLCSEEGIRTYYDYLTKIVKPTAGELRR